MKTFVLVHGAWHGAWCWARVVAQLRAHGHKVVVPDLPGHGDDRTPIAQITLQAYVDRVQRAIEAQSGPVVLVGHSMGGVVITQVAEHVPERVQTLVYVCAFLPRNGEALMDLASQDAETLVLPNLVMAPDQSSATVRAEVQREAFYGDCEQSDVARARQHLVPQAAAPFATPVVTTAQRSGAIPRVYIECLQDRAISIAAQRRMQAASPCAKVITMNTSHSPFLSAPDTLAKHLESI